MTDLIDEEVTVATNEDLTKNKKVCKFEITEKYKFIKHGFFYKIFSTILYFLAIIILYPIVWIAYGVRVKGKKNLKNVKQAIFVSNHIATLDFLTITGFAILKYRPYFLSGQYPFKLPVVRVLVRLLKAVPVPENASPTITKNFLKDVDNMLSSGGSMLVFPEGAMWNYYHKIRPFMSGSFRFSVKNDVPIVPIVATYRKPNWFYRMFGRRAPLLTYNILPPMKSVCDGTLKQKEQELEKSVHDEMENFFYNNSSYLTYTSKQVRKVLVDPSSRD